jgi:hypothetical protein
MVQDIADHVLVVNLKDIAKTLCKKSNEVSEMSYLENEHQKKLHWSETK